MMTVFFIYFNSQTWVAWLRCGRASNLRYGCGGRFPAWCRCAI